MSLLQKVVLISSLVGLFLAMIGVSIYSDYTKSLEIVRLTAENTRLQKALENASYAEALARAERRVDGPVLLLYKGVPGNVVIGHVAYTIKEAAERHYTIRQEKNGRWVLRDPLFAVVAYAQPEQDPLQKWAPR